jgi:hypothetical protein
MARLTTMALQPEISPASAPIRAQLALRGPIRFPAGPPQGWRGLAGDAVDGND